MSGFRLISFYPATGLDTQERHFDTAHNTILLPSFEQLCIFASPASPSTALDFNTSRCDASSVALINMQGTPTQLAASSFGNQGPTMITRTDPYVVGLCLCNGTWICCKYPGRRIKVNTLEGRNEQLNKKKKKHEKVGAWRVSASAGSPHSLRIFGTGAVKSKVLMCVDKDSEGLWALRGRVEGLVSGNIENSVPCMRWICRLNWDTDLWVWHTGRRWIR